MNGNMGSREYSRELITQAYIKYSYQKEKKYFYVLLETTLLTVNFGQFQFVEHTSKHTNFPRKLINLIWWVNFFSSLMLLIRVFRKNFYLTKYWTLRDERWEYLSFSSTSKGAGLLSFRKRKNFLLYIFLSVIIKLSKKKKNSNGKEKLLKFHFPPQQILYLMCKILLLISCHSLYDIDALRWQLSRRVKNFFLQHPSFFFKNT